MGTKKSHWAVLVLCTAIAVGVFGYTQSGTAPAIGLETGEKAPGFGLKDQFGRAQSNETLRGSNGTVLLFFRSADW